MKIKAPAPGVYPGVSFKNYSKWDAVNFSSLSQLAESPTQAWYSYNCNGSESSALSVGSAVHAMVLEPDSFEEQYVIAKRTTKAGKEDVAFAENNGLSVLTPGEYAQALAMFEQVMHNERVRALIRSSETEVSLVWRDQETGVLCKAREDVWCPEIGYQADLKTLKDTTCFGVSKAVVERGYHFQAQFYKRGRTALGYEVNGSAMIGVGKDAPYVCEFWTYPKELLDFAETQLSDWLGQWKLHAEDNSWFESRQIEIPAWYEDKHLTVRESSHEFTF